MNLSTSLNPYKLYLQIIGVVLLVGTIFALGWNGHRWFTKPEVKVVEKIITVTVGPPNQTPTAPVVSHGVVIPGINFGHTQDMPKPPEGSTITPLQHPSDSTVITVQVPTPMKLQVFHQNELKWARNGDTYSIWNDSRIWTLDDKGLPLPGITADTTYNKDVELKLPVTFKYECPKERPWAIGGIYKFTPAKGYGVFVDRDIMMFRLGVEAIRTNAYNLTPASTDVLVKFGGRF